MKASISTLIGLFVILTPPMLPVVAEEVAPWKIIERSDIAPVWSGHPVGFALLTTEDLQYVGFYDADRNMVIASRQPGETSWKFQVLPTKIGWDSHNYITMTLDEVGQLHVAGNMHCVPLIYFRTEEPGKIETLRRIPQMVGSEEDRCTYPRFLNDAEGRLLFTYRDGSSGNGSQIWNVYDPETETWSRLLDQPLFDGQGKMNAYFTGPLRDDDGKFHICWVWRDTPDCATNHDLSYACSPDLIHWQKSDGTPVELPLTIEKAEIIDPVPPGGGMINSNIRLGFDHQDRPIVSYHKFDENGHTQVYNARLEEGRWNIHQATDWEYRWEFQGGGSIGKEVHLSAVSVNEQGHLEQTLANPNRRGRWLLDSETLKIAGRAPSGPKMPPEVNRIELDWPKMQRMSRGDLGGDSTNRTNERWLLRWETRPSNRDRPYPGEIPPPSMLRLFHLVR